MAVVAALLAAVVAMLGVMCLRRFGTPAHSGWWAWLIALGSIVALGAMLDRGGGRMRPPRMTRFDWIALALLIGLAAVLRLYALGDIPAEIHGDSAECGNLAMQVLNGHFSQIFAFSDWYRVPFVALLPNAASFAALGPTIAALRLPSAIFGIAALVPLYFLARHWYGARVAAFAGLFYALAHPAIHFSRIGLWNIQITFLTATAFCLMVAALHRRSSTFGALAGTVAGAAMYSYTAGRIIPIILAVAVPYYAIWHRRDLKRLLPPLALCGLAFLVAIAPLALDYVQDPRAFAEDRTSGVSIFAADVLPHVEDVYHTKSHWKIFVGQAELTAEGFYGSGDASGQYGTTQTMFTPLTVLFLLLGLAVVARRGWRPHNAFVLAWLLLSLFLGSVMVIDPPSLTRWVATFPVLYILIAVGVVSILDLMRAHKAFERYGSAVALAVVLQFAAWNLVGYWRYCRRLADRPGREWDVVNALEETGPQYDYYLFTGPQMLPQSPVMRLFFRDVRTVAALSPEDLPPLLADDTAFILTPRYRDIGLNLSRRFPGIERTAVREDGITQVIVYRCSVANGCRSKL